MYVGLPYLIKKLSLPVESVSLLIRALFMRIPIIIMGAKESAVVVTIKSIVRLMPYRRPYYYGIDFFEPKELNEILKNEQISLEVPRSIFVAFPNNSLSALKTFSNLRGWVIGFTSIPSISLPVHRVFLDIDRMNIISSLNIDKRELEFELKLLKDVQSKTEWSITKLKRVLEKKLKNLEKSPFYKELLTFNDEEAHIMSDLFDERIIELVHAARRALALFYRTKALKDISGIDLKISDANIIEAVDYKYSTLSFLLDFIYFEWGIDLRELFAGKKNIALGDWIDGLWG
ncbi:MAG: hypothetical protein ACP6IS_04790 [Candidatus Asgardarchaeia archaeon]